MGASAKLLAVSKSQSFFCLTYLFYALKGLRVRVHCSLRKARDIKKGWSELVGERFEKIQLKPASDFLAGSQIPFNILN